MSLPVGALETLGPVLAYPREGCAPNFSSCRLEAEKVDTEAGAAIEAFCRSTEGLTPTELEELYTRTFDLNPVATLEVGWHVYGEQYRRGRFLVQARELLSQTGIDEQGELPDHLMSLLPALARMEPNGAAVFAGTYLIPAVDKMLAGLEGKQNPYEYVLKAVRLVLESFAVDAQPPEGPFEDDDLVRIGTSRRSPIQKGAPS